MTVKKLLDISERRYFNSHPHEEDDDIYLVCLLLYLYFNSHPHEEDDNIGEESVKLHTHFNSHPHEEDD